jgi:hypothetical protein
VAAVTYKAKLSTMLTLSNDNMSHQHHFSLSQSSGSGDIQSQTIDHAYPEQ